MPFAVVNRARVEDRAAAQRDLEQNVIPRVKQMDGLRKAVWTLDDLGSKGLAILVFDTRHQAEALVERIRSGQVQPGPGVIFEGNEILEVVGEV